MEDERERGPANWSEMGPEARGMDVQSMKAIYKEHVPALFSKILLLWKEAPASSNWALEKLMEVFCRDIAPDMQLVEAVGFQSFLNGFLEEEQLIKYPDFVMNNVALMAAEVLLSATDDFSPIENPAFTIIRSPLQYWMVTKGHRVDVAFQIFAKFVKQQKVLHSLGTVNFDVAQAIAHSLLSPFNYTRRSARNYFVELVKLVYRSGDTENVATVASDLQSKLKQVISQLFDQHNAEFSNFITTTASQPGEGDPSHHDQPPGYTMSALGNYCQLLSECALACDKWCESYSNTDLFDRVSDFLQAVASDGSVDLPELYRSCAVMLIKLIKISETRKEQRIEKFTQLLLQVAQTNNCSDLCDAIYMAGLILSRETKSTADNILLFELSLLPLFVLFGVTAQHCVNTCPNAVTTMRSFLVDEQKSKTASLIKEAVRNLFIISDRKLFNNQYSDFMSYLMLKVLKSPAEVSQPIFSGHNLRNQLFVTFLTLQFPEIIKRLEKDETCYIAAIEMYTKAFLNFPCNSHKELSIALESYVTLIRHIIQKTDMGKVMHSNVSVCPYNKDVLNDITLSLQRRLLDMDPNVRELSVKIIGDLFMIGASDLNATPAMTDCMSSLWHCVNDKSEGVAIKVLELLVEGALHGNLRGIFARLNVCEEDVKKQIHHFLLSSPWDNIKPVAFDLLANLNTDIPLIRYAEACLYQDNVRLALTVVNYIHHLFSSALVRENFHERTEGVSSLLQQGWGDLLLLKSSAVDTCCFRETSSVIRQLLEFMENSNVTKIIDEKVVGLFSGIGANLSHHFDGAHKFFSLKCQELMEVYGLTISPQEVVTLTTGQITRDTETGEVTTKRKSVAAGDGFSAEKKQRVEPQHAVDDVATGQNGMEKLFTCSVCSLLDEETLSDNETVTEKGGRTPFASRSAAMSRVVDDDGDNSQYEHYLDSTKELPAQTLNTQPFPSQTLTQMLVSKRFRNKSSHECLSLRDCLSWFVFREIFKRIEPEKLEHEAQRSTDEYERNPSIILHDLDQVLNRSFENLREQSEADLVDHFISCFASFLNKIGDICSVGLQAQLLVGLITYFHQLTLVSKDKERFLKFILQQKRCVCLHPPTEDNADGSVLVKFLKRLKYLRQVGNEFGQVKEYYTSSESFGALLNLCCESYRSPITSDIPTVGSKDLTPSDSATLKESQKVDSFSGSSIVSEQQHVPSIDELVSVMQNCVSVNHSEILAVLEHLEAEQLRYLIDIFSSDAKTPEALQEDLKVILSSQKKGMFPQIVDFLSQLSRQLIFILCDKNVQGRQEKYSHIGSGFSQLENWYVSENDDFDSDGDNDPTALDCF